MDLTFVYQVEHEAPFGLLIVLYVFLGGLSAGLFLVSSLSTVFGQENFKPLAKPASAMALGALIPGMLALNLDLGQPFRSFMLFFRFNPTSAISWGTFILSFYGLVCPIYIYNLWQERNNHVRSWGIAGVILATAVGLYTGFLLAGAPGRALWNSALLPVLFLTSGLVAAFSLLTLLQVFVPKALQLDSDYSKDATGRLLHLSRLCLIGLMALEILLVVSHFIITFTSSAAGHAVITHLISGTEVLFMFLPFIIVVFSKNSVKALGAAGLFGLIGVFSLRYTIVFGGEEFPNAGTLLYRLQEGGDWIPIIILLLFAGALILNMPRLIDKLMKIKKIAHIGENRNV